MSPRRLFVWSLGAAALGMLFASPLWPAHAARAQAPPPFAATIAALSEPGGYFDTDNLISNERSFLHVVPDLRALSAQAGRNGVYLGVGPDQSFSYIAHLRPSLAILIDIRRDNLLLHLFFKALFAASRTRVEYLALLTGRSPPSGAGWDKQSIEAIVKHIDAAKPIGEDAVRALRERLTTVVAGFGVPLTDGDRQTIDRFHRRFIQAGLSLQFNTTGRAPQYGYPTYRDLLLEVDRMGTQRSFIASEGEFQFVKDLQARHRVIPVVGDLSGQTALGAIAKHLGAAGLEVSAVYTSNVEFYLFRDGSFARFVANMARLPRQPNSVIVRSVFPAGNAPAAAVAGYNSASLTQPIQALVDGYAKGRFRQYWELTR
jgi:hypothetical protein